MKIIGEILSRRTESIEISITNWKRSSSNVQKFESQRAFVDLYPRPSYECTPLELLRNAVGGYGNCESLGRRIKMAEGRDIETKEVY